MNETTFYKYQGTGNDFIMIDDRSQTFPLEDVATIARWCDR
ncbi:MAG: diaminopimelate epimerase, partial [Nonlabens sp.]|nr:diaminopimelate epimerase [Nonlabens sp.]